VLEMAQLPSSESLGMQARPNRCFSLGNTRDGSGVLALVPLAPGSWLRGAAADGWRQLPSKTLPLCPPQGKGPGVPPAAGSPWSQSPGEGSRGGSAGAWVPCPLGPGLEAVAGKGTRMPWYSPSSRAVAPLHVNGLTCN